MQDVPTVIRELLNSVSVLSASQNTLLEQHEALKTENTALKIQIAELVSKSKETSHVDTSAHQGKETSRTTTNKESQTETASVTDLHSDSEDSERDNDESPWITVQKRQRRPKSKSGRSKSIGSNFDAAISQHRRYKNSDRNGSQNNHSRRQNKRPFERRYHDHRDHGNLDNKHRFHNNRPHNGHSRLRIERRGSSYRSHDHGDHDRWQDKIVDHDIYEWPEEEYITYMYNSRKAFFNCGLTNHRFKIYNI